MTNSLTALFLKWYFLEFPVQILENGKNFLVWAWRWFSVGFFIPRLFSPWHLDITSYGRGFDFSVWMHAMGWNLISRFIGTIIRSSLIITGLAASAFIFSATILFFVFWFGLPAILIYLLTSIF
jgi:hypothetical protein